MHHSYFVQSFNPYHLIPVPSIRISRGIATRPRRSMRWVAAGPASWISRRVARITMARMRVAAGVARWVARGVMTARVIAGGIGRTPALLVAGVELAVGITGRHGVHCGGRSPYFGWIVIGGTPLAVTAGVGRTWYSPTVGATPFAVGGIGGCQCNKGGNRCDLESTRWMRWNFKWWKNP